MLKLKSRRIDFDIMSNENEFTYYMGETDGEDGRTWEAQGVKLKNVNGVSGLANRMSDTDDKIDYLGQLYYGKTVVEWITSLMGLLGDTFDSDTALELGLSDGIMEIAMLVYAYQLTFVKEDDVGVFIWKHWHPKFKSVRDQWPKGLLKQRPMPLFETRKGGLFNSKK